jgi:hypothetical protein
MKRAWRLVVIGYLFSVIGQEKEGRVGQAEFLSFKL